MLLNLSYIGEIMLGTCEKSCISLRRQKLGCKKRDGTGCTIGRIRQRAQGNVGRKDDHHTSKESGYLRSSRT